MQGLNFDVRFASVLKEARLRQIKLFVTDKNKTHLFGTYSK